MTLMKFLTFMIIDGQFYYGLSQWSDNNQ
jgi:hypothetical protein